MQLRVFAGSLLILAAMAAAAVLTYRSSQELYFSVDEFRDGAPAEMLDPASARRVQVRGAVDYESVQRPETGLSLAFVLVGDGHRLPVRYDGVVPDTFEQAESVTVAGHMGPDGTFVADQLFVQCPSKYEAVPPGAEPAEARG